MTDETVTNRNALKPVRCGCGGEAILKHYCYSYGDDDQYYFVWCERCDIQTKTYPTEAEAVEAWNRAMGKRTVKVEAVEKPIIGDTEGKTIKVTSCGNCKNTVSIFDNFCPGCGCRLIWGDDNE